MAPHDAGTSGHQQFPVPSTMTKKIHVRLIIPFLFTRYIISGLYCSSSGPWNAEVEINLPNPRFRPGGARNLPPVLLLKH